MKKNSLIKLWALIAAALMSVSILVTTIYADGIKGIQIVKSEGTTKSVVRTKRKSKIDTTRSAMDENNLAEIILQSQKAKPEEIVEVPLILNTGNQCTAYALLAEYDSRLELIEVDGANMSTNFEQDGKQYVSIVGYDSTPYIDGEAVAVIKFRIPENAENDKYSVKFSEITTLSGDNGEIENYKTKNANITVTGGVEKKATIGLELTDVTGINGGTAVVQLIPNSNNTCSSFDILIEYDSRLLLEDSDIAGASTFCIYNENGKSFIALVGYANGFYADGEAMAALNFHLPYDCESNDEFEVKIADVAIFQTTYSSFKTTDAVISVIKSLRPNDKYKDVMTFLKYNKFGEIIASYVGYRGDANGDNIVDIRDAAFIARCVAGRRIDKIDEMNKFFGDVNEDGIIDIRDAALIARYIAKRTDSWDDVIK